MNKIFVILFFATLISAQTPEPYARVGDKIYNNAVLLQNIKDIPELSMISEKLTVYLEDVSVAKEIGYNLESNKGGVSKKFYLFHLRELESQNSYFLDYIYLVYKEALKSQNSELFVKLINLGLLDVEQYKEEILDYYQSHKDEIEISGVIELFLNEEQKEKEKVKKVIQKRGLSAEQIKAARLKRIKENDKKKQEALTKKLQNETLEKKKEIRAKQQQDLSD